MLICFFFFPRTVKKAIKVFPEVASSELCCDSLLLMGHFEARALFHNKHKKMKAPLKATALSQQLLSRARPSTTIKSYNN